MLVAIIVSGLGTTDPCLELCPIIPSIPAELGDLHQSKYAAL